MKFIHVVLLLACTIYVQDQPTAKASADLVHRLITALNSRNTETIRDFLKSNATTDVPLNDRVDRMAGFAMQGAPFRLEAEPKVSTGEIRAVLIDKQGVSLNLAIVITESDPPKIKSVRVMPSRAVKPLGEWSDIGGLAKALVADRGLPAMGITLVRNGNTESAAAGVRDAGGSNPVGPDEPWSIGSIGKPICTTVIAKLIETGKLRWDETLKEALPGMPMRPGYETSTLEQIMKHRGGIPQDLNFSHERVVGIVGSAKTPIAMRERYCRDILSREPIARPGQRNAYSNAGYALLGHIAERVAGKPYEVLVKELVFAPLGLKHSYTGIDTLPAARPSGHERGQGGLARANMSGPIEFLVAPAGGGMFMSTSDLARFGQEHLKGLRGVDGLLKAATVKRLHQGLSERPGDQSFLYACGWESKQIQE